MLTETAGQVPVEQGTVAHRIAAVTRLLNQHSIDVPIPRVQIADVCALDGVDWIAHLQDWAEPLPDTIAYNWYDAVHTVTWAARCLG